MEMFADLPMWIQFLIPRATAATILVGSAWAFIVFGKFLVKLLRSDKSAAD